MKAKNKDNRYNKSARTKIDRSQQDALELHKKKLFQPISEDQVKKQLSCIKRNTFVQNKIESFVLITKSDAVREAFKKIDC